MRCKQRWYVHRLRGFAFFWAPNYFRLAGMWMWLLQLGQHSGLKVVEPQDRRSQGPCPVESHACLGLPASGLLLQEGDKYFYFVSITASLDFIPCNFSVPCSNCACNWTHITMTPFMWKKNEETYICVPDGRFWLWHRNPKVICFNIEDILLSYITSPEVGQLQGWLIPWLDFITKDSGTSHLSALPSSD